MLHINDEAPNFTVETPQGASNLHAWMGGGCAMGEVRWGWPACGLV
jgi:hypothetical protein